MNNRSKHLKSAEIRKACSKYRKNGKKIVFTYGTFDLIHSGHAAYLLDAKTYGDILIVGISSNKSYREMRGKGLPLIDQKNRAELIGAMDFVDHTVILDKRKLLPVLKKVRPDVLYTLAIDWRSHLRKPEERRYIKNYGGRIVKVKKYKPFVSASAIVKGVADIKIKEIIEYFFGKVEIDLGKGDWKKTRWSGLKTNIRSERLRFGNQLKRLGIFAAPYMNKVVGGSDLEKLGNKLRRQGKKIVLSSGACDLLHAGHVRFYSRAKSLGDVLVLGIPSNVTIRKQKGRGRPIVDEYSRAELMSFFPFVDYIVVFEEDSVTPLIKSLKPDIFFTVREDWNDITKSPIYEMLKKWGGRIEMVPPQSLNLSSSALIRKSAGLRVKQVFKEVLNEAESITAFKD